MRAANPVIAVLHFLTLAGCAGTVFQRYRLLRGNRRQNMIRGGERMNFAKAMVFLVSIASSALFAQQKVTLKMYSGELVIGEFVSATDSSVTYKTAMGPVTILKRLIVSVSDQPEKQSDPLSNLSDSLRKFYQSRRMVIELEGAGVSQSDPYLLVSVYGTWRKWTAFEGFRKLKEEEFFEKCGYQNEGKQAENYHSSAKSLRTAGLVMSLAGAGSLYAGYTQKKTEKILNSSVEVADPNTGLILAGYLTAGIGSALVIASAIGESKNWAPYSTVQMLADEYNRKLLNQITRP